ncbi:MAG TPA: hypothetical protein VNA04_05825 [Thermoanaerobaculia bacterium]|nr:hypothetical protein [Thermoanaerobaculia bacterium]
MRRLFLASLALFAATPLAAQLPDGDVHWSRRAEGNSGGRAAAGPIDSAIAAYERAVTRQPDAIEPRWKLLRALRFKGAYVARSNEEKKEVYSRARTAGEEALQVVYRHIEGRGLPSPQKAPEQKVAAVVRQVPGAAQFFVWDAVNWGEWALASGKIAAARQGAADRIRRHATIAHLADPAVEGGTPSRVLGRLHAETPRIPFITGWASGREAVKFLEQSLKIDPDNKITIVFLAEALVSERTDARPRAIQMLRKAVAAPGDPDYRVEQAAAAEDARALLTKWGA